MIVTVTVEVYDPDKADAGTGTHHPIGFAAVLPPRVIVFSPLPGAVS
jgi:hypothetical protein